MHTTNPQTESPAPTQPEPAALPTDGNQDNLLNQIVSTSLGPLSQLSRTLNLTLDQVSEWIAKPENRRHVFNLLSLLDAQTQLLISQERLLAAVRLAEIIRNERAGSETVRRACKDLLNMRVVERKPTRGSRGGNDLEPLPLPKPPMSHADILRGLRTMM